MLNSARQHVLATYDIMDNDGVRLSLLKVLLNHTIYNHSMNAIFNGDIEEYKDTVDLNKRVAQVIKMVLILLIQFITILLVKLLLWKI